MTLPAVRGVIRRRILVNFRVDTEVMQRQLPPPFHPKLLGDAAMAGICLIRLEEMRPACLPLPLGLSSENAAHRIAVCWTGSEGQAEEGVFIPRRDTDSPLNRLAGGRTFAGVYHAAAFQVEDTGDRIDFRMRSADGVAAVELRARISGELPPSSRFASLKEASAFFETGSLGYSPDGAGRLEGIRLVTDRWHVTPLAVEHVYSSFFADEARFPPGSVEPDCALLMRDIPHHWLGED